MKNKNSSKEHYDKPFYAKKSTRLFEILIVLILPGILFVISNRLGYDSVLGIALGVLGYVINIVLVWRILKLHKTGFHEIGLARPKSWLRTVLLGIGVSIVTIITNVALQVLILNLFSSWIGPVDESKFDLLKGNLHLLLFGVVSAWTTITFSEEIVYRAFLINWLAPLFGNTKVAWRVALIVSAIVFGFAHFVEGPLGILVTATIGIIFGSSYLRTERNLWVTIIAHGILNTLRFVLVFAGA